MSLYFEDTDGRVGKITDDLELQYDGRWEADIREYVERVEAEHRDGHGDGPELRPLGALVVELPKETPVVETHRDG